MGISNHEYTIINSKKIINSMKIGLKDDKKKNYEKTRLTENRIIKVKLTKDSSKTNKQKNSFSKSKSNPKKDIFIITTDDPNNERNSANLRNKRKSKSKNISNNKIFKITGFSKKKNIEDNQIVGIKNYPFFVAEKEISKLIIYIIIFYIIIFNLS